MIHRAPDSLSKDRPSEFEFIALFAYLTSLTALSIDAILPGLPAIERVFSSDAHLTISVLIIGMALGELIFGPLADARGRKTAIATGIVLFIIGALIAYYSQSFPVLLFARFLQGVGVAGPKIGSRAAIRDRYSGDDMARVMSVVMAILILVPMLAPALGQLAMNLGSWRIVFLVYIGASLAGLVWLLCRQPETLPHAARQAFCWRRVSRLAWRIATHPQVFHAMLIAGLVFGCLAGFYGIAAQLFGEAFGIVPLFPAYFAVLAAGVGAASLLNSRLVRKFGMYALCRIALWGLFLTGCGFVSLSLAQHGAPGLTGFMAIQTVSMFCIGMVFGNIGAMAMAPLGAVAGVGASVVAAGSSAVAFAVSLLIGRLHDHSLIPHAVGLIVCASVSLCLLRFSARCGDACAEPVSNR